jgi:prepilin-type N-terminal cleavage/methylation domain-containing protein
MLRHVTICETSEGFETVARQIQQGYDTAQEHCGVSYSTFGFERAERMRWSRTSGSVGKGRRSPLVRGQRGFVLIEVLMSIAIFGVISVAFLSALVTGYHGIVVAHDQTMAQSLTRTKFEDIRNETSAITDNVTPGSKFDVVVDAEYIKKDYTPSSIPSDLQRIIVTIRYHVSLKTIWVTEGIWVKPG